MDVYQQTVSNRAVTTAQTIVQIVAPSTCRLQLTKLKISFDGTSSVAEPCDIVLVQQTGAGTSSAGTISKTDTAAPTALGTSRVSFTVEPASDDAEVDRFTLHPQGGIYEDTWQIGDKTAPMIAVSGRLGVKITAAATVNATVTVQWAE